LRGPDPAVVWLAPRVRAMHRRSARLRTRPTSTRSSAAKARNLDDRRQRVSLRRFHARSCSHVRAEYRVRGRDGHFLNNVVPRQSPR
jgi:hypothetical protein